MDGGDALWIPTVEKGRREQEEAKETRTEWNGGRDGTWGERSGGKVGVYMALGGGAVGFAR